LPDFDERGVVSGRHLTSLLAWSEEDFLRITEGSPIRRIGHARWLRNVALALGNALRALTPDPANSESAGALRSSLAGRLDHPDPVVREQVVWALAQGACGVAAAPLS
jgi:epoxyqueuosine reductase